MRVFGFVVLGSGVFGFRVQDLGFQVAGFTRDCRTAPIQSSEGS